jgi:peptidoglycan-N-acetylglucosamine deacetylase
MTGLMVSIDLDDAWAYLRAHNDPAWTDAPSVIPLATERLIEVLDAADIEHATVFVVGRDARAPVGIQAIGAFTARGLEIADHSDAHRGELASLSLPEIAHDLRSSGDAIAQVTGSRPVGFRCPSFGASEDLSSALRSLGYRYDASGLPTPLMPLLRLYHRLTAGKGDHPPSYGNLRTAFGTLRPTLTAGVLSVPTTTVPGLRTPFHGSYLSALAGRSPSVARAYARLADRACRAFDLPVSFLLHPTDVLDSTDAPHLAYFPGMTVPWRAKRSLLTDTLSRMADGRAVAPIGGLLPNDPVNTTTNITEGP